jgi:hypothetical protein
MGIPRVFIVISILIYGPDLFLLLLLVLLLLFTHHGAFLLTHHCAIGMSSWLMIFYVCGCRLNVTTFYGNLIPRFDSMDEEQSRRNKATVKVSLS